MESESHFPNIVKTPKGQMLRGWALGDVPRWSKTWLLRLKPPHKDQKPQYAFFKIRDNLKMACKREWNECTWQSLIKGLKNQMRGEAQQQNQPWPHARYHNQLAASRSSHWPQNGKLWPGMAEAVYDVKRKCTEVSLGAQCLKLNASTTKPLGSIPGQRTKILQALLASQKKKKRKCKNMKQLCWCLDWQPQSHF